MIHRLRLNHALYNAALLSLYKVLEKQKERLHLSVPLYEGADLLFDERFLEGFEFAWEEVMVERFKKNTALYSFFVKANDLTEKSDQKDVKDCFELLKRKVESNSYKAGYTIANDNSLSPLDCLDAVKKTKSTKGIFDIPAFLQAVAPIVEYFHKHENVFYMKDIMYSIIQRYWENMAMFQIKNLTRSIPLSFKEAFVDPCIAFCKEDTRKKTAFCLECGCAMHSSLSKPMTWLCDVGVDDARKKSNYWNFKPDTYLCPLCALAYACLPIGFSIAGEIGTIINRNDSIEALIELNTKDTAIHELQNLHQNQRSKNYYAIVRTSENEAKKRQSVYQPNSIQILSRIRKKEKVFYSSEILDAHKIAFFKCSGEILNALIHCKLKISDNEHSKLNMFEESMDCVMKGQNLFELIHLALSTAFTGNTFVPWVGMLIQLNAHEKNMYEGVEQMQTNNKIAYARNKDMARCGYALRKEYVGGQGEKNENVLKGYAYALLNLARTENATDFTDTIVRMYMGLNKEIPQQLIQALLEKETFQEAAYSYILGLNGNPDYQKKDTVE